MRTASLVKNLASPESSQLRNSLHLGSRTGLEPYEYVSLEALVYLQQIPPSLLRYTSRIYIHVRCL